VIIALFFVSPTKRKFFMKSFKMLPDQRHPKTNGRDTLGNTASSGKGMLTGNQQRNKQRQKRNATEKTRDDASMHRQLNMTIHEIRNPLTAISLANQSIQEQIQMEQLPDSVFACTAIINKNIIMIEKILKDLLTASTGEKTTMMPIDVCFAIENCLCKTDDRIFLKKIEIHKSYAPGLLVQGNVESLSVAFSNIIVNAIEAVRESEGKIWITAYEVKDKVKVIFKDNGDGMEPEVANHMFEKNFSKKSKGLGVGLSHVKDVLDRHNASVSVNSEPGTGTTILIEFKKF
jgi:signal transduction histidine kinase